MSKIKAAAKIYILLILFKKNILLPINALLIAYPSAVAQGKKYLSLLQNYKRKSHKNQMAFSFFVLACPLPLERSL